MRINSICHNYFSPTYNVKTKEKRKKTETVSIAASYFTGVIPLAIGMALAITEVRKQVHRNPHNNATKQKVHSTAEENNLTLNKENSIPSSLTSSLQNIDAQKENILPKCIAEIKSQDSTNSDNLEVITKRIKTNLNYREQFLTKAFKAMQQCQTQYDKEAFERWFTFALNNPTFLNAPEVFMKYWIANRSKRSEEWKNGEDDVIYFLKTVTP